MRISEGFIMPTIKDVARDAGVAVGTASKVVNGLHVSEENRKKVENSIQKLGYKVNYYARGLKTTHTNTIAVIIPDIKNPFFALLVYYIEKELYEKNYKMLLCHTQNNIEKEASYLKMTSQNKVDGIIVITYNPTDTYVSSNMPIVNIDRHFTKETCCVASDNYQGGQLAARKLMEKGCRRLLYIRTGSNINNETIKRKYGFHDACEEAGIAYDILDLGDDSYTFYPEEIRKFLEKHRTYGGLSYDGIHTSTDSLALVVLDQLNLLNIRVPDQVQLIGFDGLRRLNVGPYMVSSIKQPVSKIAKVSVENVLKLIRGEKTERLNLLPVEFVEGGTTKP